MTEPDFLARAEQQNKQLPVSGEDDDEESEAGDGWTVTVNVDMVALLSRGLMMF
jgi:hypothetical protein